MSQLAEFDLNDTVTVRVEFRVGDILTNPTSVTSVVTNPAGTVTNPSVTNDSTGKYSLNIVPTVVGEWTVTLTGTGAVVAAETTRFAVRR